MTLFPKEIIKQMETAGVVAGFYVENVEHAVPIARALLAGGHNVIELKLRTPSALDALQAICEEVPEIVAGVGTILTPEQARQVKEAGATFGVSPGMNPEVIKACKKSELPFAPGIVSPSDLEAAIALGCRFVKFFPAEAAGGVSYLRSMSTPYNHLQIQYFPLGGIHLDNMASYLNEPNVPTVGGSWIVKKELIENEDWIGIRSRAKEVRNAVDSAKTDVHLV
jgi:2-dehydro-3-deoxyphosphogluconate aldolase/(4S)-4-hydroxy-2-oxoglutarate aldolase